MLPRKRLFQLEGCAPEVVAGAQDRWAAGLVLRQWTACGNRWHSRAGQRRRRRASSRTVPRPPTSTSAPPRRAVPRPSVAFPGTRARRCAGPVVHPSPALFKTGCSCWGGALATNGRVTCTCFDCLVAWMSRASLSSCTYFYCILNHVVLVIGAIADCHMLVR